MLQRKKTFLSALVASLFLPAFCTAATTVDAGSANYNATQLFLIGLVVVLVFVIGVLANAMRQLSFVVRDKNRSERSNNAVIGKIATLLLLLLSSIHVCAAEDVTKQIAPSVIAGMPAIEFYLLISLIIFELLIVFALSIYIHMLLKIIRGKPELAQEAKAIARKSWFWDKFNNAATIEREQDVLLDHNYDGIMELDNSLPPWWKYGFYLTIVIAGMYVYRFHFSDGPSQVDEYVAEMQKGEEDKAAYLAHSANNVDENTVVMLADGGALASGKDLFIKNCAACHLADGGGTVGPNLTDDYWLHGGSIKDIFKSIKYGWQDKGMKAWKDDFSPKQMQELTSFIRTLKGTHPVAPKLPQGDLYTEDSQPAGKDTVASGKLSLK